MPGNRSDLRGDGRLFWTVTVMIPANSSYPDDLPAGAARHRSVLSEEVIAALDPRAGEIFIDGTTGAGGHAAAIAECGAKVIGLDRDIDALAIAQTRLERYGDQVRLVHANFRHLEDVLDQVGIKSVDGALLDLGISSMQVDEPERGFSFLRSGPLDMRMDPSQGRTAADYVNDEPEQELERLFKELGEEPQARKAARLIADRRETQPFETTEDLASLLETGLGRFSGKHPGTRCFQALRIAVNDELGAVEEALPAFTHRLKPGGRFAVITFHSLEDRMVKRFFKHRSTRELDRPEWPAPRPNPDFCFERLTSGALPPSDAETTANPRARSAKLRAVRKVHPPAPEPT